MRKLILFEDQLTMSSYYNSKKHKKYRQNNNNGGVCGDMHNMALENSSNKRPALYPNMKIDKLGTKVSFKNLHPTDPMYQTIEDLITNETIVIENIVEVNNPFLQQMYEAKKQQNKREFGGIVDEQYLFHGTKKANVKRICRYNFKKRGHKFDKGVSFSDDADYASYYSDDGYHKVMIVGKVLIANICGGNEEMELPPMSYDTTQSRVLVKVEDNEYYPAYKLYYHFEEKSDDEWDEDDDGCQDEDDDWDEDDDQWEDEDDERDEDDDSWEEENDEWDEDDDCWEDEDDEWEEFYNWWENEENELEAYFVWWQNGDDYFYYDDGYGSDTDESDEDDDWWENKDDYDDSEWEEDDDYFYDDDGYGNY